MAAELDPLAGPAVAEAAVARAKGAGLPVECCLHENYGHTLVMTRELPDTITWLLARAR